MPASICASVPKNTSSSDRTNSTTVRRSDASRTRARQATEGRCLWAAGASGVGAGLTEGGDALGAAWTEVSLIGGSGEGQFLGEAVEVGQLAADERGGAEQLEVPGG